MRTLQEVLIDRYYTGRQRRRAANAFDMSWLITQNRRLINENEKINVTNYRYYSVNGMYKRVIELDCDGEAFFVCPCTEGAKDFNKLVEMGWEVIPDSYMGMYSKEVKAL